MGQRIQELDLYDISRAVERVDSLMDEEKASKFLELVEDHLSLLPDSFFLSKTASACKSLGTLYQVLAFKREGSPQFMRRLERLLEEDLERFPSVHLPPHLRDSLFTALAIQNSVSQPVLQKLMLEFEKQVRVGEANCYHCFVALRALHTLGLLDAETSSQVAGYLAKRGYDSDDLLALSSSRGGHRRGLHLLEILSQSAPQLKNKAFLNIALAFCQQAKHSMSAFQKLRLESALSKFEGLRNNRVLLQFQREVSEAKVNRQSWGGQRGQFSEKSQQDLEREFENDWDFKFNPDESGYFTEELSEQEGFY
jgi:hypothetical protein